MISQERTYEITNLCVCPAIPHLFVNQQLQTWQRFKTLRLCTANLTYTESILK
jgi:hypothetical protein